MIATAHHKLFNFEPLTLDNRANLTAVFLFVLSGLKGTQTEKKTVPESGCLWSSAMDALMFLRGETTREDLLLLFSRFWIFLANLTDMLEIRVKCVSRVKSQDGKIDTQY